MRSVDFSNVNTVWVSVLVETLYRLGLRTAVVCPGSRSAPLAVAFARHQQIEAIPVLDERSAAFFALGLARQSRRPTALVCTSGTAAAHFYPAVIESHESRVPLLVLTADRPPELRQCNAGQAIDQQKLYGSYVNGYYELAVPELDAGLLAYLRQTVVHAWERSLYPVAGPVHLNLPFREPLTPAPHPDAQAWGDTFDIEEDIEEFFAGIAPPIESSSLQVQPTGTAAPLPLADWHHWERGVLIAGVAQPPSPREYCAAIAHLSKTLGVPVLAEGLSPVRNYAALNPYLVSAYDRILRQPELSDKLKPDFVIRVGDMPTSRVLRQWLSQTQPRQWVIDPSDRNLDPTHGRTIHLRLTIEQLAMRLLPLPPPLPSPYLNLWCEAEAQTRQSLDQALAQPDLWFEGQVAWLLSQHLPPQTPIFISSSTPVRDVEWFWQPGDREIQPFFNRGANGIDGILSTALGIAHRHRSTVLLTGDLAFLHDTNGLLLRHHFTGHLTIVLINNNGGGIFENLPIAQFDPPFETFFATPQAIDFAQLCRTYDVAYERIESWVQFIQRIQVLPTTGIRVLEVPCDRKADAQWRKRLLGG
ncbi:MAG: 2-succinyl-5-enolpyruvyl-6-hydroxy-3-cyclohexene-1-carboxylic-acid synthase [Synechococcales cyanobacterium C42_A2020_086]|nr:2-succinyl-5-enolpyruvyl-6-hydroxy-3-cyclohexene-1-carboxylic-acid synthase [Synechococcales cyanobacterium C42_A2020_086]